MSAQPYSLENTVKGTVGSHSLLTAQVSINRAPSSHNPWTCSCHSFLSADQVCLQTYPAPSASPTPALLYPRKSVKPTWCLRSHTMSWSYLSQYLHFSSATWPCQDSGCVFCRLGMVLTRIQQCQAAWWWHCTISGYQKYMLLLWDIKCGEIPPEEIIHWYFIPEYIVCCPWWDLVEGGHSSSKQYRFRKD